MDQYRCSTLLESHAVNRIKCHIKEDYLRMSGSRLKEIIDNRNESLRNTYTECGEGWVRVSSGSALRVSSECPVSTNLTIAHILSIFGPHIVEFQLLEDLA